MTTELTMAAQQALEAWQTACYGQPSHQRAMLLAMTELRKILEDKRAPSQRSEVQTKNLLGGGIPGPATQQATPEPIPMVLHCPKCGMQHIDEAEEERVEQICEGPEVVDEVIVGWDNPPHRSHLCHGCGTIWRPADVPTTGVKSISTKGKADTWEPGQTATPEPVGEPVADVPIHPRQGPLWANVRPRGADTPMPSYPTRPLVFADTRPAQGLPEGLDEDQLHTVERAADLLEHYAAYINEVKPDDIERHPYLPEIELTAADLRALSKRGGDA